MTEKPSLFARLFTWAGGYVGCAAILSTFLGLVAGICCGLFIGERRGYYRQYSEEREQIEPIVAGDPAFSDLQIIMRSNGGIDMYGTVPTQADHDRLHERIIRVVGEKRAREIMQPVFVHP